MENKNNKNEKIDELLKIMHILRGKDGCSWDRAQTHKTLIKCLREETEEVIENIEKGKIGDELKEELGDVLLQVIFHSEIAMEENRFSFYDVVDTLIKKLKFRHPHVFNKDSLKISHKLSPREVSVLWEKMKEKEKLKK